MPQKRPATSGYARLAQAEAEDEYLDDSGDDELQRPRLIGTASDQQYTPIQPGRRSRPGLSDTFSSPRLSSSSYRRRRAHSGVDIKAINARLEKWADEIASKFKLRKIKGKTADEEKLEIHHSVFQPPEGMRPATAEMLATYFLDRPDDRITKLQFDDIVESVRVAIELGVHPKMISQGSSGSYFARNSDGKVVAVFKPKDEEPYASRNPKWTKWIHRNLFPFFFGRACLIPNLCYVSEAAAYVLDSRLQTNLVPYTDIVYLSSISFNYDFWQRRAYYRKMKPLPQKVGSFQVFLRGYQDANLFLKKYPWPDQQASNLDAPSMVKHKRKRRKWTDECTPNRNMDQEQDDDDENEEEGAEPQRRRGFWTENLQQSFREELEKLVILDYIMRNTDRGLDNWMIKINTETQKASIVAEMPKKENGHLGEESENDPYKREGEMTANGSPKPPQEQENSKIVVGAIDNSLSWPWKHPDAWRSFPFGWLFLPVSLIGQPFTEKTRKHFLPLLTSKQWWSDTQIALRHCFTADADFKERMFARQIAVMKGQAWNVVETLKTPDHGPLELTRRARVCVWDDLVDIPVVVPLRQQPDESQQQQQQREDSVLANVQEEMDLGAANLRAETQSLRGLSPSAHEHNRFNLSREGSSQKPRRPSDASDVSGYKGIVRVSAEDEEPRRTHAVGSRSKLRLSFDEHRRTGSSMMQKHKRTFSFTGRQVNDQAAEAFEGDLGFAAARDMEANRKKVIVERLETVKSKNPVFTWC